MTTTQNLQNLAKDPQAFDTRLMDLHKELGDHQARLNSVNLRIRVEAGQKLTGYGRDRAWNGTLPVAVTTVRERGTVRARQLTADRSIAEYNVGEALAAINEMDDVYSEYRWTRFFPSVTKSQPHIHRSLSCHTLHATTVMSRAPQLSGKTDEEAVSELDEALCSVCFPSAPVALHNYVSRKSQAERDARATEKATRDLAKAAKQLTEAEQFRTGGRYGDRVTTVAACKELIRRAVELAVEVDWWSSNSPLNVGVYRADLLANRRRNGLESLEEARKDAAEAQRVLVAREDAHESWGMTEKDIDLMIARKDKSARKEWGL